MSISSLSDNEIIEAFLDAFPEHSILKRMLQIQLNTNLEAVAGGNNLTDIVFALIRWARAEGRLMELVEGAAKQNPGNPELRRLVELVENGVATNVERVYSEDGQRVANLDSIQQPHPSFNAAFLSGLDAPGGAVQLRDQFYVQRDADSQLTELVLKLGSTTTIRGARQTGKTSLLARGIHHARNAGGKTIWIDFQEFDGMRLDTISVFLHTLAINVCRELRMDNSSVHQYRQDNTITPQSFTAFLEDRILCHSDSPVIFAMDEADSILRTSFYQDFFGLVRSWHNRRAVRPEPWQKLNIVLIISTEPYLLIDDINQSPFNVGARIELSDFTENLVHDLNQRHGYPLTVEQVQSLMHLVNGQPYLIRKALYELAKDRITWDQLMKSATAEQGPFSDHLRHLYSIIVEQPALSRALQSVIHTQRSSHSGMSNSFWGMIRKSFKPERQSVSTDLMRLERAGIIKKVDAQYVCRCELYQRYFQEKFA